MIPILFSQKSPKEIYFQTKVKVKYTLVQALRLCTGRTAHRGSRGIKVKAIPLQACTGPEGSRKLRLPGFKTIGT